VPTARFPGGVDAQGPFDRTLRAIEVLRSYGEPSVLEHLERDRPSQRAAYAGSSASARS